MVERYNCTPPALLIAHLSGGQRRKVAMLAGILPGFVETTTDSPLDEQLPDSMNHRSLLVEDLLELKQRGNASSLQAIKPIFPTVQPMSSMDWN